jgi:hypothetical protein
LIKNADLKPSSEFLSDVKTRTNGVIKITAESNGKVIAEASYDIAVLARDEWFGTGMAEMTASFITPDDPEVLRIAANAAKLLDTWLGSAIMDRYSSGDRSKVRRDLGAIYGALQQFDIRSIPSDNVAKNGCRIASAKKIIDKGAGTSLDLTLLFVSCAESVGLNTAVIFTKERTVAGIWLDNTTFGMPKQADISALMRAVRDGSLMLVDCEGFAYNRKVDIEASEISAKKALLNEKDFLLALDTACMRGTGARTPSVPKERPRVEKKNVTAGSQAIIEKSPPPKDAAAGNELTRRGLWEGDLLDMSFRNDLLSMKITDTLLPVMASNVAVLKDMLAGGNEFHVLGKPTEWDNRILNEAPFELSRYVGRHEALIEQELRKGCLRSPYGERDVSRRLAKIHKISESGRENCENSLFIVLGVLKWFESDGKVIYSPIMLMPAETFVGSADGNITIKAMDDEAVINKTLLEKLRRTHDINLSLDPLPTDRMGADTGKAFSAIRNAIRAMDGWDIIDGAFIGIFHPERYDMWNNLRGRSDALFSNKLTKSLMDGRPARWQEAEKDDALCKNMVLAFEAGYSQMRAIKAAVSGRTFVLDGPSGTGRRQTICNIISESIYRKKTVLVVSENHETLRSLKRRLDNIGIGRFCLQLTSGSASKKKVLDHFKETLDASYLTHVDGFSFKADWIQKACADLSGQALAVRRMTGCGVSIYDLATRYDGLRDRPFRKMDIPADIVNTVNPGSIGKWEAMVKELTDAARGLGHPARHPLSDLRISELKDGDEARIAEKLRSWIGTAEKKEKMEEELTSLLIKEGRKEGVVALASLVLSLKDLPEGIIGNDKITVMAGRARELLKAMRHSFEVIDNIANNITRETAEEYIHLLKKEHGRIRSALDDLKDITFKDTDTALMEEYGNEIAAIGGKIVTAMKYLKDLRTEWNDSILKVNFGEIMRRWNDANERKLFPGSAKKSFMNGILKHLKNSFTTFEGLPSAMRPVEVYFTAMDDIEESLNAADVLRGGRFSKLADDCRSLENTCVLIESKIAALNRHGNADDICNRYVTLPRAKGCAAELISVSSKLSDDRRTVEKMLDTEIIKAVDNDRLDEWVSVSNKWIANMNSLAAIADWNKRRKALENEGLGCVIDAYMDGMPHDLAEISFTNSLLESLINGYTMREPSIAASDASSFIERSSKFREAAEKFIQISRKEMNAALESRVPSLTAEISADT